MGQKEKLSTSGYLSFSDWLSFLETRSSNYISALSIGASAVAIVVSILGSSVKLELHWILLVFVLTLVVLHGLTSWMVGGSILVEVIEAKRISDLIAEGEFDTLGKIENSWRERETRLGSWLYNKLK